LTIDYLIPNAGNKPSGKVKTVYLCMHKKSGKKRILADDLKNPLKSAC
jgi:hypothetical protein